MHSKCEGDRSQLLEFNRQSTEAGAVSFGFNQVPSCPQEFPIVSIMRRNTLANSQSPANPLNLPSIFRFPHRPSNIHNRLSTPFESPPNLQSPSSPPKTFQTQQLSFSPSVHPPINSSPPSSHPIPIPTSLPQFSFQILFALDRK
jgi:hypothetical protein